MISNLNIIFQEEYIIYLKLSQAQEQISISSFFMVQYIHKMIYNSNKSGQSINPNQSIWYHSVNGVHMILKTRYGQNFVFISIGETNTEETDLNTLS